MGQEKLYEYSIKELIANSDLCQLRHLYYSGQLSEKAKKQLVQAHDALHAKMLTTKRMSRIRLIAYLYKTYLFQYGECEERDRRYSYYGSLYEEWYSLLKTVQQKKEFLKHTGSGSKYHKLVYDNIDMLNAQRITNSKRIRYIHAKPYPKESREERRIVLIGCTILMLSHDPQSLDAFIEKIKNLKLLSNIDNLARLYPSCPQKLENKFVALLVKEIAEMHTIQQAKRLYDRAWKLPKHRLTIIKFWHSKISTSDEAKELLDAVKVFKPGIGNIDPSCMTYYKSCIEKWIMLPKK